MWNLYLDDIRHPSDTWKEEIWDLNHKEWIVARSSSDARLLVIFHGLPATMSLDHDLGGEDTAMVFLKWLATEYWMPTMTIPEYYIHSQNPIGAGNIYSFMLSWKKSCQ